VPPAVLPSAVALATDNVPASTCVCPSYVFAPESASMPPALAWTTLPEPEMLPGTEREAVRLKTIVEPLASAIGPEPSDPTAPPLYDVGAGDPVIPPAPTCNAPALTSTTPLNGLSAIRIVVPEPYCAMCPLAPPTMGKILPIVTASLRLNESVAPAAIRMLP